MTRDRSQLPAARRQKAEYVRGRTAKSAFIMVRLATFPVLREAKRGIVYIIATNPPLHVVVHARRPV